MENLEKHLNEKPPMQLYHYTGKESFLGIIKNKYFWASHILFQNDRSETEIAFNLLKDTIVNISNGIINENNLDFVKSFLGRDCFTVSFSSKPDNLGQYRAYATDTPGYCIGFRTTYLKQCLDNHSNKEIISSMSWQDANEESISNKAYKYILAKCIYDLGKQKQIIDEIIDVSLKGIDFKQENIDLLIGGKIIPEMLKIASLFKSQSFEEEDEWRLIITNVKDKQKIKERTGKSYFIPYFELDFSEQECIGDIIIGPCADEKIIEYSVQRICFSHDIEFLRSECRQLKHSSIPYRYW